ncbi:MAG: Co2+/Mg2+ efflux protein ApaG [Idiomarina sp.]|jgi:ApaG protein|uniref:Co2+/Mg2+ efflux protein ApaG n=1 Tax=Idiomarina sp. TaxID=1874361 RepID=UPI000C684BAD|nr:Co2+/Mg2+ efflux protein ApaG [Idiomarina sp.]MAK70845.1 Co2+/Mg2+ efflux protein ApaG [Idiomarinaceae bacterium]MBT43188.1 Co2+/Mg2+ efflux protein ApaG [Idiomarina sp.]HAD47261.1 Co2+/Mg2+ efflux protein ApaG [Idiomarina sp.]
MSETNKVDITVTTQYLAAQSVPENGQYVFSYTIIIANNANSSVQLLSREWRIVDADNKVTRVAGEGVVGQKPLIKPEESFSYTSGTVLATPIGTMQGHYLMVDADGCHFKVEIPSFRLAIPNIIH